MSKSVDENKESLNNEPDPFDYNPELDKPESPIHKFIKKAVIAALFLGLMGTCYYGMNRYMEWRYPTPIGSVPLEEEEEESTTISDSDLNVKIDDRREGGKSLEEILGDDIVLGTKEEIRSSESSEDNSENNNESGSVNKSIAEGEDSMEGSVNETVGEEQIEAIIESRIESDAQPVESGGVEDLHNYYESVGESMVNDPEFQKQLKENVH